jgi:hypothetical protein
MDGFSGDACDIGPTPTKVMAQITSGAARETTMIPTSNGSRLEATTSAAKSDGRGGVGDGDQDDAAIGDDESITEAEVFEKAETKASSGSDRNKVGGGTIAASLIAALLLCVLIVVLAQRKKENDAKNVRLAALMRRSKGHSANHPNASVDCTTATMHTATPSTGSGPVSSVTNLMYLGNQTLTNTSSLASGQPVDAAYTTYGPQATLSLDTPGFAIVQPAGAANTTYGPTDDMHDAYYNADVPQAVMSGTPLAAYGEDVTYAIPLDQVAAPSSSAMVATPSDQAVYAVPFENEGGDDVYATCGNDNTAPQRVSKRGFNSDV